MGKSKVLFRMKVPHKITLYKNGDNPYIYYYFTWKKKSHRGSTGTIDVDESRKKIMEIFYEISKGIREGVKIMKFEYLVKEFLKWKKDKVSVRTMDDYERGSRFLLERFKGKDVHSVCNQSEFDNYKIWRENYYDIYKKKRVRYYNRDGKVLKSRECNHVGHVVINRERRLLKSIFLYGRKHLGLFKNIDIPDYEGLEENRREELLTKEEYIKLRDYWMKKNEFIGNIIRFYNSTGIRPSELNKIQWKDVNLKEDFFIIRNRKSKGNKLISSVPLVGTSREVILWLQSREGIEKGPENYVFVDNSGCQIKRFVRSFKNSLEILGINNKITFSSFRHGYITRMVKRGDISLPILSDIVGHTTTLTLQKHYLHLNPKDKVREIRRSEERRKKMKK